MKKNNFRYSDAITTARIIWVAIFSINICFKPQMFGLIPGLLLIAFIFATDALDGMVARKLGETSKSGAFFDIVADRITETALLVPFIYLKVASPIVLIFFLVKDFLVDHIRFKKFILASEVPFKQLTDPLNTFLVSSRFMRALYGALKMVMVFVFYALIFYTNADLKRIGTIVTVFTMLVALARTIPVFIEYYKQADSD